MLAPPDTEMRGAASAKGDPKSQTNNNTLKFKTDELSRQQESSQADFALAAIKSAVLRLDEIRQELINAGLALKASYITPQMALDWAEEFAPGCLGYIPPQSGLTVPLKRVAR
jgi:hypothetical protein